MFPLRKPPFRVFGQVCRWIAYSEQHQETSLDYRLLLKILKQLNDKFTQDALTYEEVRSG